MTLDENGKIDFADKSVTENTRVSYPIEHIENIVKKVRPISAGPDAKNVIFLSADAFGVLPPVSVLTPDQTKYYFLSGFTAKRHRARHHRAHPHLLRLLRPGVPGAPSHQVR